MVELGLRNVNATLPRSVIGQAIRGKPAICNMRDAIREIFAMSGFLSILVVCDGLEDAEKAVEA